MSKYADKLEVDRRRDDDEGRKQENRRIIAGLENLIAAYHIIDKDVFVEELRNLGLDIGDGFEARSIEEMRGEAVAVLTKMREMFSGALRVTANVKDSLDTRNIEAQLAKLSERFMSVDDMNEALKNLGVNVEIPKDEIARLKSLLPKEFTDGHRRAITTLQEACERKSAPLIMQLPGKIMVDGVEIPFTIRTMCEIMSKAKEAGSLAKTLRISSFAPQAIQDQTLDSKLGVWTSTCLEGSKGMKYGDDGQLAYQLEVLGEDRGIHADVILAMVLRYIQSGEELVISDVMRLNDLASDGDPFCILVNDDDFELDGSDGLPHSEIGIGGSFRISP